MKPSQYETQAQSVADKIGIEVITAFQGMQCPTWANGKRSDRTPTRMDCADCGTVHGDKFRVTIRRKGTKGAALHFDFWASYADCYATVGQTRKWSPTERKDRGLPMLPSSLIHDPDFKIVHLRHKPSVYDVLCCVSADMRNPTEADDVAEEFGDMKPSQAERIAAWARKIQSFFTEAERTQLAEVQ